MHQRSRGRDERDTEQQRMVSDVSDDDGASPREVDIYETGLRNSPEHTFDGMRKRKPIGKRIRYHPR